MHKFVRTANDRSLLDPTTLDRRATEWKFGNLDADKSDNLNKTEYRDLRRLVRKVVRPKRCARAFIRMCDTDRNSVLSRPEWTECMLLNGERRRFNRKLTSPDNHTRKDFTPPPSLVKWYRSKLNTTLFLTITMSHFNILNSELLTYFILTILI